MRTTTFILLGIPAVAALLLANFEAAFSLAFAAGFTAFAVRDCARTIHPVEPAAPVLGFAPMAERLPYAA